METNYLSYMRQERSKIRNRVAGAKEKWEQHLASQKKSVLAKARSKQATLDIAKKIVFLPLDVDRNYFDIQKIYNISKNPLINCHLGDFQFSEAQLCEDLNAKGYSTEELSFSVHNSAKGAFGIKWSINTKIHCVEKWIKMEQIYKWINENAKTFSCTKCIVSFKGVDMIIYRFFLPSCPYGRFFVIPATQLCECPIPMDELSFYQFDTTSLLIDMVDEFNERQVIFKQYTKKLSIKQLDANSIEIQDLRFWDEKRVSQAAQDYCMKDYSYEDGLKMLKNNLMNPLKKYFNSCLLSHPEDIKYRKGFETEIGVWIVCISKEYKNFKHVLILVTSNDRNTFSFTFDNNQYSQYALDQYLTKVVEFGNLWTKLVDHFHLEFMKQCKIKLLNNNLK